MKVINYAALILFTVGFSVSSVQAAEEVTQQQVDRMHFTSLGTVTTTAQATAPMDARHLLSKKADEKGGKYFRIIAGREHGRISAIAEVYK